ncbi:MAG: response regulator [Streptosporangiales bacterium]|nr:response regulator [Streptosporangiales bacterium]
MTVRVLVADDHPLVRLGLRTVLEQADGVDLVGEACDGAEALALANALRPDVVLMDLRMPEVDGATATASLCRRLPDVRVLVLTTYDSDADIAKAVGAGATGYLLKDASHDDLLAAVRAAARGESAVSPRVATRLMNQVRAPASQGLSRRETEILRLVAAGCTNKEIAGTMHLSLSTIKTHLLHVFAKLGVDDRTAAVVAATDAGYLDTGR